MKGFGVSSFWNAVRASYWFLPSLMAVSAIALGAVAVWLDVGPGSSWLEGLGWYQSAKPEGAQQVLSTIAGSMITVAGVVFSITIVALAYASSQYGPRLLTNFMSDRGNQVTLGTFIATFLYCLVVLRTIRGGEEGSFVPQIAVMIGMLMGLMSIGVLIYFIHHVPQSIHINHVAARIGRQLLQGVEQRFPRRIGEAPELGDLAGRRPAEALTALCGDGPRHRIAEVTGCETGYIQAIDEERLMRAACKHDLVLRLAHRPGDFLHRGRRLLEAWPAERVDAAAEAIRASYTVGDKRTPFSDLDFLVGELVEIAARALSTGVNDPATARTCLDWLGAGASEMAQRHVPAAERADPDGTIRVIARPDDFDLYFVRSFGALRQYVARDRNAALHWLATASDIAASCVRADQLRAIRRETDRFLESAENALDAPAWAEVAASGEKTGASIAAASEAISRVERSIRGDSAPVRSDGSAIPTTAGSSAASS
jgi:uncharacterized membrane protein